MKILGLSFSLKRAIGVTAVKKKISKKTGIPTAKRDWSARLAVRL